MICLHSDSPGRTDGNILIAHQIVRWHLNKLLTNLLSTVLSIWKIHKATDVRSVYQLKTILPELKLYLKSSFNNILGFLKSLVWFFKRDKALVPSKMNLLPQFLYSHILEDPITTLQLKIAKNNFQILQIKPNMHLQCYTLESPRKRM